MGGPSYCQRAWKELEQECLAAGSSPSEDVLIAKARVLLAESLLPDELNQLVGMPPELFRVTAAFMLYGRDAENSSHISSPVIEQITGRVVICLHESLFGEFKMRVSRIRHAEIMRVLCLAGRGDRMVFVQSPLPFNRLRRCRVLTPEVLADAGRVFVLG